MSSTTILSDNGASSGSAGLKQTAGNDGVLILQTTTSGGTATNAIYVDTSQNVMLGGTSGIAKLSVANNTSDSTYNTRIYGVAGTSTTYLDSDAANWWGSGLGEFQIQNGTATRPAMLSLGGTVNAAEGMGVINFFRSSNTDNYRARAQIAGILTNTGTADQYGGNIVFYTSADGSANPSERMRILNSGSILSLSGGSTTATGTGIAFPATQSASTDANTLDDYEEGTWTPTDVSGAGLTFTTTFARYTKIGNQVTITCQTQFPSTANGSPAKIGGIPFVNGTPNQPGSILSLNANAQKNILYDTSVYVFPVNSVTQAVNSALSTSTVYISVTYLI